MTVDLFQAIVEKARMIGDQKIRFESLSDRAETSRKDGQTISLPEFEAFGWAHFEEFLNRFEDSVNSPLLEMVRGLLEDAGVILNSQMLERLKAGLTMRRERLVEIVEQTAKELEKIAIREVEERAKQDVGRCLEEGKWDNLIEKVNGWYHLEQQLSSIARQKKKNTFLYNAIFDLALQEGPQSKVVQRLAEVENTAHTLGGEVLKQQIRFELPENPEAPLTSVEANLGILAQKKEQTRQLQGEDAQLDKFITKSATLKGIIDAVEKEREAASESLERENKRLSGLLERRNSLAVLLKEGPRSLPADLDMKKVKMLIDQLEGDIKRLSAELEKGLSVDARILIENLLGSKLPVGWDAQRVISPIRELLSKGFSFEVKRRE